MTLNIPFVSEADTGTCWCAVARDAKAPQETNRVHVQVVAAGALPAATLPALLALTLALAALTATGLRGRARPRIGG